MPPKRKTRHNSPQTPRRAPWSTRHPSQPQVELHLGPDRTPAYVSRSLFPTSSMLYHQPSDLEKEDATLVSFLLYSLHFHTLPVVQKNDDADLSAITDAFYGPDGDRGARKTHNLIHMYLLCETYDIDNLRIDCLDELFWHIRSSEDANLPVPEDIRLAYQQLGEEAALYKFLVDVVWHDASHRYWHCVDMEVLPKPFLRDVLTNYAKIRMGELDADTVMDVCDYHEHEGEGEREACVRKQAEGG